MNLPKVTLALLLLFTSLFATAGKRYIEVKAGDVQSLLQALDEAAKLNDSPTAKPLFILIPDGVYDLADKVLTTVSGYNIALVGESTEGTIIMNAPDVKNEGIGTTATLLNRGHNIYVQDLTLRNALDYYHSGAAGRAVCWQDKGERTIFKNVRMLSYQDTYYSYNEECQHYFEDSEIHGTVDFICGAGDVYFNRCRLVTEKRNPDGSGVNVIAAPRTSSTQWGYVFHECTISNDQSAFHLARGWHTHPRCVWLNTCLESPEKLAPERFDPLSIRSAQCEFGEYGTTNTEGHMITPASNIITIKGKDEQKSVETTLTATAASRFTLKNVFPDWKPDKITRKLSKQCKALKRQLAKKNLK